MSPDHIIKRDSPLVLIVDDDATIRMLARTSLEQSGFSVEEAADGDHVLEEYTRLQPDIVLLDVMMPGKDGFTVCHELRSMPGGDRVPVVMMTGLDDIESISRAYEVGATEFLTKPINWMTLGHHVRYMLRASKAFEDLQISEMRNQALLKAIPDFMFQIKHDAVITNCTAANSTYLGFSTNSLTGKKLYDVLPNELAEQIMQMVALTLCSTDTHIFEYQHLLDGRSYYYELRFVGSSKTECLAIVRDVTEQAEARDEIKRGKDFFEAVIESSMDAIAISDAMGTIMSANTAMEKIFRYSKEELIGKHLSELVIDDPEMRNSIRSRTLEIFEKSGISYEALYKTRDGSVIETECSSSLIKDSEGNYCAGVTIIRDTSRRKKLERHLLQAEKLKSLGELAAGVAHDFNNVLAVIIGRAQILKNSFALPPGHERRKAVIDLVKGLEVIEKAALDGAETVLRIQQFSRKSIDTKDVDILDMNKLLSDVMEFTKVKWDHDARLRGVKYSVQKNFAPLSPVAGRGSQLREVFINLINNALDAMPNGGSITIKTCMLDNQAIIQVEDDGPGIPEETRTRIFDPFFTTKGIQSTGLGLSISYGIINAHHGTIHVDSAEGKGTTFTICLPEAQQLTPTIQPEQTQTPSRGEATVLVIEDEEEIRELLCEIISSCGNSVETAQDGSQGIKLFSQKPFDMVFTDLGMPGLTGWQVAQEIKKLNSSTPVALITGYCIPDDSDELQQKGVDFVLNKPFLIDQVLKLVQEGLALKDIQQGRQHLH
jgi:PAS domain S-box-containing protein